MVKVGADGNIFGSRSLCTDLAVLPSGPSTQSISTQNMHLYVCMYVCMYIWVRMYGCVRVCMGVYVYVCMYVSIYIPVLKNVVKLKMYIEYINLFFKCVDRNDDIYGELQASLMAESQLSLLYQSQ